MKKLFRNVFAAATLMFALSLSAKAEIFTAYLTGAQEVPPVATSATGYARIKVDPVAGTLTFTVVFNNLSSAQTASHIHAPAAIGVATGVAINFGVVGGTSGTISGTTTITPTQLAQLRAHLGYVNVHSVNFSGGEIRGQLGVERPVDTDGDGRQDYNVLRFPNVTPPGVSQIDNWNLNSTAGISVRTFGDANRDYPAPGDYDGDGITDIAYYRAGATAGAQSIFWVLRSSDGTAQAIEWGLQGDTPCARDYDGDGKTDPATFRPGATPGAQAIFYIKESTTGQQRNVLFGTTGVTGSNGDVPVVGDYDGDGKTDIAVYRWGGLSPNNTYIILRSSDGVITYTPFANFNTDYLVPGDFDGDGKTDLSVARTGALSTSPMVWWIKLSSDGSVITRPFGISSDLPVQGDYDGDARTDIAVYRRGASPTANSTFWVIRSFDQTTSATLWGLQGDFPVATFDAR